MFSVAVEGAFSDSGSTSSGPLKRWGLSGSQATSPIVSFPSQLLTISIIEERVAWLEELGTIKNATDLVVGALRADGKHWCTIASIFGRGHTR
ncbi:hypothetical protein L917_13649 [Phytophthora nicotianae]|uniref:Uncharacterized protein n=1 Tax=Phytophthora nicotianae TaxID=4792 RepID=W2KPQ8_PHYNI|nr:hypothetical protein L917_13649 [Phytophthora nicotianae]